MARRKSRHSAIQFQISVRVKAPKNGRPLSEAVIREAIDYRIENGEDPPGIEVMLVSWTHPPSTREHSASNSDDEWSQFKVFLQRASYVIVPFKKIGSR